MSTSSDQKLGAANIAALVRREISKGNLQLHDRLPPERVLAETYGAARGTIRKALTRLEQEGYVEIRAGSGTYVVHKPDRSTTDAIENATPLELMDTRFALEPHVCRLAVLHPHRRAPATTARGGSRPCACWFQRTPSNLGLACSSNL